jgi:hypothetical protein
MTKNKAFSEFVNLYPVQKTLRFELIPQGKTMDFFEKSVLFENDKEKAEKYKIVKQMVDDCHRDFISKCLKESEIDWEPLAELLKRSKREKDKASKKELENGQEKARKEIISLFSGNSKFKDLFEEKMLSILIPAAIDLDPSQIEALESFKKFSGYFLGLHENRRNMYSEGDEKVSIAYRIVNDNFSKFIENVEKYEIIRKNAPEIIKQAESSLSDRNLIMDDIFSIKNFNKVLDQEGIDLYNFAIGGESTEEYEKYQGLNELLNEYDHQNEPKLKLKMTRLFKQILSISHSFSYIPKFFETDEEVISAAKQFFSYLGDESIFSRISNLIRRYDEFNAEGIFVNQKSLSDVSIKIFGQWDILGGLLVKYFAESRGDSQLKKTRKPIQKQLSAKAFTLRDIMGALELHDSGTGFDAYASAIAESIGAIEEAKKKVSFGKGVKISGDESNHVDLKELLDKVQDLYRMLRPFEITSDESRDNEFYSEFDDIFSAIFGIVPLYNKTRNYITKNKFNTEKIKLNFGNPTLAAGWDLNKEQDNKSLILRKDGKYYLAIVNPKTKIVFPAEQRSCTDSCYQKMVYKLLPGPNKMLPKVLLVSEKGKRTYNPSEYIHEGYNAGKHKKGEAFDIKFCRDLIDFFKDAMSKNKDWNVFNFKFSPTESYGDISQFYKEVERQGYALSFVDIPQKEIDEHVEGGSMFLFQIYNKDFSERRSENSKENLHTTYWKALFDQENLSNVCAKLNGEAELFFREKSDIGKITHKKGQIMVNRRGKDQMPIPDGIYYELFRYHNGCLENELSPAAKRYIDEDLITVFGAKYDIVKDRRYTQDKMYFHVPITLNFACDGRENINKKVMDHVVKSGSNLRILGIDRGERNLLYYSLIDRKGNIIKQGDLNTINGFDYHEKLDHRERERDVARKSWNSIENIKDLKSGYLSHAVHEISKMIIENNAVVVLEDLNFGFKRGRFKIEKQIYQKFEKMLIDKLNYLMFKDHNFNEPGGVLRSYQLTAPFESFTKLGKQTGALFYVPAAYTSKIDPVTGFVNVFNTSDISTQEPRREFIRNFESIVYDAGANSFAFTFNYSNFKVSVKDHRNSWTIYALQRSDRYLTKERKKEEVYPVKNIKDALSAAGISYSDKEDILPRILENGSLKLTDVIYFAFQESIKLRVKLDDRDEIISPVPNELGDRFMTDENNEKLPKNADANGAYCIALKGEMLLRQIEDNYDPAAKKMEMPKIENAKWLEYMQSGRWK